MPVYTNVITFHTEYSHGQRMDIRLWLSVELIHNIKYFDDRLSNYTTVTVIIIYVVRNDTFLEVEVIFCE